jgi:hypothetical protein
LKDVLFPLALYLKNEFPTRVIYSINRRKQAGQDNIPDDNILLQDTGGGDTPDFRWVNQTIQIIVRDIEDPKAKQLALDIYNKIHGVFGLILPSVVVNGITYDEIETEQINGIQRPFGLGVDDNGRTQYTTNYQLYYVGG